MDDPVVTAAGDLCTIKDCCVVVCESDGAVTNPAKLFRDHDKLHAAYEAVRSSTEKLHGWQIAESVYRILLSLPVRYNARLTRAVGRAKFKSVQGSAVATEIELTAAYEIPETYMHRLLVHEGCHVARSVIEPVVFNYENPHGRDWQMLMIEAGQEPRATCIDPEIAAQRRKIAGHPDVGLTRADVAVGDRVSFLAGKKRGRIVGVVTQKTERAAMIRDDNNGSWRVGYVLLIKESSP